MKRVFSIKKAVIFSAVIAGGILVFLSLNDKERKDEFSPARSTYAPPPKTAVVDSIVDAITVKLATGHTVRYLGVRPPDVFEQVECFGKEAVLANETIIGKKVRLEEDPVLSRAQDGAWVRYVFMMQKDIKESGENNNEIFINQRILEGGLAFPLVSEEMSYGESLLSAARFASATGKGLWGHCDVIDRNGYFVTQAIEECVIKGRVTDDGRKIYRTPKCAAYKQTVVIKSEGGRWFCAEDIARSDGWEKAPDCK